MSIEEIICIGLLLLVFLVVVVLGRVFDSSPYTPEIKKQELLDKTRTMFVLDVSKSIMGYQIAITTIKT